MLVKWEWTVPSNQQQQSAISSQARCGIHINSWRSAWIDTQVWLSPPHLSNTSIQTHRNLLGVFATTAGTCQLRGGSAMAETRPLHILAATHGFVRLGGRHPAPGKMHLEWRQRQMLLNPGKAISSSGTQRTGNLLLGNMVPWEKDKELLCLKGSWQIAIQNLITSTKAPSLARCSG